MPGGLGSQETARSPGEVGLRGSGEASGGAGLETPNPFSPIRGRAGAAAWRRGLLWLPGDTQHQARHKGRGGSAKGYRTQETFPRKGWHAWGDLWSERRPRRRSSCQFRSPTVGAASIRDDFSGRAACMRASPTSLPPYNGACNALTIHGTRALRHRAIGGMPRSPRAAPIAAVEGPTAHRWAKGFAAA